MRLPFPYATAVLLCLAGPAFAAGTVDKVEVKGLDDELMVENIQAALTLNQSIGKRLGESRLEYLLQEAQAEAREALEPFGYYSPTITVDAPRGAAGEDDRRDDHITVTVTVQLGEPVRVRHSHLRIEGEGADDKYLKQDLAAFKPAKGEVFDHTTYETSKLIIVQRLAERGYLDADFLERKVEVTRADHAADIELGWVSGIRYNMGPTRFHQDYFNPGLLDRLVYWEEGSYYHQGKLDRLRQSLVGLDYFSGIDIQPDPESAVDGRVPIDVNLTLAKRSIYTYGLSYGTESGAGVRAGLDRRYVNSRGHKLSAMLDYAQKRKQLSTLYRIPAFKWLDGWYGIGATLYDEQTDYIDTRRIEFVGSRSGQINEYLTANVSLHTLRERWRYDTTGGYQYSTLTYPEISAQYVDVDNRLFPRRGFVGTASLRAGVEGAGSDATFGQLRTSVQWHHGVGEVDRLLVRGEVGTTWTNDLVSMPPSLRFFAGGDRSVRGYAWREVGPRLSNGYALGAKHVVTGSVEYEHYFNAGPYGMAVFVDTGSAFDDTPDFQTGVGVGARWRSPIGPVRVDIAHGLDNPDSAVQLYLSIGVGL
ncbi:MAG: autotransporter assembly complex family protein [Pseudoxanthomonas sp.]